MTPADCEGCRFLQITTFNTYTTYRCFRNQRPIHLFNDCPKNRPMTKKVFIKTVKAKLLAMIGDGLDSKEEPLRDILHWIESIEQE